MRLQYMYLLSVYETFKDKNYRLQTFGDTLSYSLTCFTVGLMP